MLKSSINLTRYRIVEPVPTAILADPAAYLRRRAFVPIDATTDVRSAGWVGFEDLLDVGLDRAPILKGTYLTFALREDVRRISPAVYHLRFREAQEKALTKAREKGRKFLSKDERQEIKEQVRLRLLARTQPIPASHAVVWSEPANTVYLGSVTPRVRELFVDFFKATFELTLDPLTPYFLALHLEGSAVESRLETVEESDFTA